MSRFWTLTLALSLFLGFSSCNKDKDEPEPPLGTVSGVISDGSTGDPISGAMVILFNANSNEPIGNVKYTNSEGEYKFVTSPGNYYVRVYAQGYGQSPAKNLSAIPFAIVDDGVTSNPVSLYPLTGDYGKISGQVMGSTSPVAGALVVAEASAEAYSTISDSSGQYIIYNVPAGSYSVNAWKKGVTANGVSASVQVGQETSGVNLTASATSGSTVSGSITFLATGNKEVDVALTHPITEEVIPGLVTMTSGQGYSIAGVPNGTYLARASYANDGIVVDPDWIVKNGEPFVTVSGSTTRDFSVTGSVELSSPTNPASSAQPVASSSNPTFSWESYSSTSDYVIEVRDASGKLIWGGFSNDWSTKNIVIPSSQRSIAFNADGNALENLEVGRVYRWRVYASKDSSQSPTGWELISMSEDQRGLIIIE